MDIANEKFFDRLFQGRIIWSLHTAMTCDLTYVSALVKKQQSEDSLHSSGACAFFYDYNPKKGRNITCKMKSPGFSVVDLVKYTYKLQGKQTHHAKISLVCYEENGERNYRLAVYSKNLEFSNNIDAALLFDLKVGEEVTESGRQLLGYINKLRKITEDKGKVWLDEHVTEEVKRELKNISLISEIIDRNNGESYKAELYFGGCDEANATLGELLELNRCNNNSVVLTPPEFVRSTVERGTAAEEFFRSKNILYDIDVQKSKEKHASHIKLYLLEKQGVYEFWTGSANATAQGLGWDFKNHLKANHASIECLVKFVLSYGNEFWSMRNSFVNAQEKLAHNYGKFDFDKQEGSLKDVTTDELGAYVVSNYECTEVKYDIEKREIKVILNRKESEGEGVVPKGADCIPWRPLEYSDNQYGDFSKNGQIELTYQYDKFEKAQGVLVFGSSCCVMDVYDKLPQEIERKRNKLVKDSMLTKWLLDSECIPDAENMKWEDKRKWVYNVLKGNNPADLSDDKSVDFQALNSDFVGEGEQENYDGFLPKIMGEMKSVPMDFQLNAAERICEIFKENSRAFLADEPGLGKTFTSAMVMHKLAKSDDSKPFFVIYVAPNLALIESNGAELVRKYKAASGQDNIVLLNDLASNAESLKTAYRSYYSKKKWDVKGRKNGEQIINILKEEYAYVMTEIDNVLKQDAKAFEGSRTKIKNFVNHLWRKNGDNHYYPNWNNVLLKYEYYQKPLLPDRVAYANAMLESKADALKGKVVIITISAEVALGEMRRNSSESEKYVIDGKKYNNRESFTRAFLEKYKPGLIIWDEYHRYIMKLKRKNSFFDFEKEAECGLKNLFVSATPYRTNISGKENEEALETLYEKSFDDLSPDTGLPSFEEDFCPLFCGGKAGISANELNGAYGRFLTGEGKEELENLLKKQMVRNERTRLRKNYEPHKRLYDSGEQYTREYGEVLTNTFAQCKLLGDAGYPKGAIKWSQLLPWILCFSTERTSVEDKRKRNKTSYFDLLQPRGECSADLFVYDDNGKVKEELLKTLPKQNLAMYQICEKNIPGRRAAQLLWMPPTVPLYQAGEESIFTEYSDYSKILVFAEFRYLQRGGARLLSDYCRLLCKTGDGEEIIPELKVEYTEYSTPYEQFMDTDCLIMSDNRDKSLDALLDDMSISGCTENEVMKQKLYLLASPAMCAKRLLGGYEIELTEAFNCYFNSQGVKEALWSWLKDNGYSDVDKREEGILRYCAEGNLYAVLEEWLFCMKDKNPEKQLEFIESVLMRTHSTVGVQTHKSTVMTPHESGKTAVCGFAEQLTDDVSDVGSGQKEESKECVNSFNSPFYPMIMFAGRGAQEGIDMHNYCMRIMHLTLPKGAVSFEQRNGRIDRYRSLLIRRRAAEYTAGMPVETNSGCSQLMARIFEYLIRHRDEDDVNKEDIIYPNWSIYNEKSHWSFEELMPVWDFTEESCFVSVMDEMLESYRKSMGAHDNLDSIDLSTINQS